MGRLDHGHEVDTLIIQGTCVCLLNLVSKVSKLDLSVLRLLSFKSDPVHRCICNLSKAPVANEVKRHNF